MMKAPDSTSLVVAVHQEEEMPRQRGKHVSPCLLSLHPSPSPPFSSSSSPPPGSGQHGEGDHAMEDGGVTYLGGEHGVGLGTTHTGMQSLEEEEDGEKGGDGEVEDRSISPSSHPQTIKLPSDKYREAS